MQSLPWPDEGSTIAWSWTEPGEARGALWAVAALLVSRRRPSRPRPSTPPSPRRLRRIETAFRSGEAGSLRPAFTAKAQGARRPQGRDGGSGVLRSQPARGHLRPHLRREPHAPVLVPRRRRHGHDSRRGLRARALAAQGERRAGPTRRTPSPSPCARRAATGASTRSARRADRARGLTTPRWRSRAVCGLVFLMADVSPVPETPPPPARSAAGPLAAAALVVADVLWRAPASEPPDRRRRPAARGDGAPLAPLARRRSPRSSCSSRPRPPCTSTSRPRAGRAGRTRARRPGWPPSRSAPARSSSGSRPSRPRWPRFPMRRPRSPATAPPSCGSSASWRSGPATATPRPPSPSTRCPCARSPGPGAPPIPPSSRASSASARTCSSSAAPSPRPSCRASPFARAAAARRARGRGHRRPAHRRPPQRPQRVPARLRPAGRIGRRRRVPLRRRPRGERGAASVRPRRSPASSSATASCARPTAACWRRCARSCRRWTRRSARWRRTTGARSRWWRRPCSCSGRPASGASRDGAPGAGRSRPPPAGSCSSTSRPRFRCSPPSSSPPTRTPPRSSGPLLISPIDLLLTAVALLVLGARWPSTASRRLPRGGPSVLRLVGASLLAVPVLVATMRLIADTVVNCSLDLTMLPLVPRSLAHLAIHLALLCVVAAGGLALATVLTLGGPGPASGQARAALVLGLSAVATLAARLWPGGQGGPSGRCRRCSCSPCRWRWRSRGRQGRERLRATRRGARAAVALLGVAALAALLYPTLVHFTQQTLRVQIERDYAAARPPPAGVAAIRPAGDGARHRLR